MTLSPALRESALFLRKFLRHGTRVASVAPSSPWLSQAIADELPLEPGQVVVELGAGTGPITEALRKRAERVKGVTLIAFELDPDFCASLRERLPDVDLVEGDACRFAQELEKRGIARADHIVSGMPFPSLPPKSQNAMMEGVRSMLASGGLFVQITELALVYKPLYERLFDDVRFEFVLRNIPPSGYYVCRNPR